MKGVVHYAAEVLDGITPEMRADVRTVCALAETRRARAKKDTGTISEAAALYLRALTTSLQPMNAVEVGTFIGTSAEAIVCRHLYTCDQKNDCLAPSHHVTVFPFQTSTQMLTVLHQGHLRVDFFFFDGRIQEDDLPLIHELSKPSTVYAFDDHHDGEKGVVNVRRLLPWLSSYELIPPPARVLDLESTTTIALLVPRRH